MTCFRELELPAPAFRLARGGGPRGSCRHIWFAEALLSCIEIYVANIYSCETMRDNILALEIDARLCSPSIRTT